LEPEQLLKDVTTMLSLNTDDQKILIRRTKFFLCDAAVENSQAKGSVGWVAYAAKIAEFGSMFKPVLQSVYLRAIDMLWVEHLKYYMQGIRAIIIILQGICPDRSN